MLISASRRTDLPAFHTEWLMNRLRAGEVLVRNPMNARQVSRVSLACADVDALIFWTKDASALLPHLPEIEDMDHKYLFQYTLTPYSTDIEPQVNKRQALDALLKLSSRLGPSRVVWRYDPILLGGGWTIERHLTAFAQLARCLEGAADRCVISFVDDYARMKRTASWIHAPSEPGMHLLAREIAAMARAHGMIPSACAEKADFTADGLENRACIDPTDIERLLRLPIRPQKDTGQRSACRCIKSVDIGSYDTCRHGCLYCYACHTGQTIPCDDTAPVLGRPLTGGEQITLRREPRLTAPGTQTSLFASE